MKTDQDLPQKLTRPFLCHISFHCLPRMIFGENAECVQDSWILTYQLVYAYSVRSIFELVEQGSEFGICDIISSFRDAREFLPEKWIVEYVDASGVGCVVTVVRIKTYYRRLWRFRLFWLWQWPFGYIVSNSMLWQSGEGERLLTHMHCNSHVWLDDRFPY